MISLLEMLTSEGKKLKPCPPATLLLTVSKFLFPNEALSLLAVLYNTQYILCFSLPQKCSRQLSAEHISHSYLCCCAFQCFQTLQAGS